MGSCDHVFQVGVAAGSLLSPVCADLSGRLGAAIMVPRAQSADGRRGPCAERGGANGEAAGGQRVGASPPGALLTGSSL